MEVVASLSQGRTAAAHCGLFIYKSVPVIFEPPCTNLEEEEIVDAPGNDGNASIPEQVKRPNPWRKMMMMMMMMIVGHSAK